ncbi:MAG: glycoside hydrolase family 31 protein, partial [Spirochaetota bacterium]|nr:glycoside hydrolase family 31 protein [Spirochaetota bacterium]
LRPPPGLRIYGLGEKMGLLERSGRVWEMWNTDEPVQTPTQDPLYVSIPFALCRIDMQWFGVFVDNPVRQYWDTRDCERGKLTVDVEDHNLDIYLIRGGGPREIVRRYTALTGLPPLPPLWSLGYHQSRYSYMNQQEVIDTAAQFRANALPADVIHLDIDYMDGYRVFTWDPERFPEPETMCRELHAMGFRVVTIVDPGVKCDRGYSVYWEGEKKGYFCLLPDGTVYRGAVWPGTAVFPDFSWKKVRTWWAGQHAALFDAGVAGIWNDMNEPADFTGDPVYRPDFTVPDELRIQNEGEPGDFRRFHNLYGSAMNAAAREAFATHRPGQRGFIISRAGYAGVQRFAGIWTGDNTSWWEHLAAEVPMILNLGISGVALTGADVGGFQEDASAQLYARWFAFGAFTPYFRNHTEKGTAAHEPWAFGPQTLEIARHYLRLRYALLPYLYTAFYQASSVGEPVVKPLFFDWPNDQRLETLDDQYLFGDAFMVAPAVHPNKIHRDVYLPQGKWYDFWDDTLGEGGTDLLAPAPITRLPLWVRGGSIIPHEDPRLHTDEARSTVLLLDVYPDRTGAAEGLLYADDEEGWEYKEGAYCLLRFSYSMNTLTIEMEHRGFQTQWDSLEVHLHTGLRRRPGEGTARPVPAADPLMIDPNRIELPHPFAGGGAGVSTFRGPLKPGMMRLG